MMRSSTSYQLDPRLDGIKFINIYTKAATRLGRLLTNLADIPLTHPKYGTFRTAEGLWYYLKTGMCHESLRALTGFDAKKYGTTLKNVWNDNFQEEFKEGLRNKLENHAELMALFLESELPFEHFYYYESKTAEDIPKVVEPRDVRWLTEFWTELRIELQF